MKRVFTIILTIVLSFTFLTACSNSANQSDSIEIFRDKGFNNGFILKGLTENDGEQTILDFGGNVQKGSSPIWGLAQYGSKFNLKDGGQRKSGDYYQYWTNDKHVDYNLRTKTITLSCDAYQHYGDTPRGTNGTSNSWPHLLVNQNFATLDRLVDYESLELTIKFKLNYMENKHDSEYYLQNLSRCCAQLVFFITIQNKDNRSLDKGEYFWFGVPLYDSRWVDEQERFQVGTQMQDQGNIDKVGTGAYIYGLKPCDVLPEIPQVGTIYEIKLDLLDQIESAFTYIKSITDSSGAPCYFANSKIENMALGVMNTGWEMPGTFNGSVTYYDISLKAKLYDGLY